MNPTTRVTATPGTPAPLSGTTTPRVPDPHTTELYRRAAGQRCWSCNAPDSEPVRLQRRIGDRWVADATAQLCTACLMALRTPRLVRQLGLGRATAALPARRAAAGPASEAAPDLAADAPGERPLTLLKEA